MADGNTQRALLAQKAIGLEYFTVFINIAEGLASIGFGGVANSIALIGFGIDSFVESISGIFVLRRFKAEARGGNDNEVLESRATRYVGWSFIILSTYIGFESIQKLLRHEIPDPSIGGIIVAILSLIIMPLLSYRKKQTGVKLQSRAMISDSKETLACSLLSAELLIGLTLNA
jgi:divalent metal cation (Fe/Co/Zn/Cd) transporter